MDERSPAPPAGRVLVIDDEPQLVAIASRALSPLGIDVDRAYDGTAGLAMARRGGYDLVLLDLRLPELSGISVLQGIMESHPDHRVIVCSALSDPEQEVRCLDLGAAGYLTKPLDLGQLVVRVRAELSVPRSTLQNGTQRSLR